MFNFAKLKEEKESEEMFNFAKFKEEPEEPNDSCLFDFSKLKEEPEEEFEDLDEEIVFEEIKKDETYQDLEIVNIDLNFEEDFFKKGDFVKIIYKKGSGLNVYKGYNGEIKTYFKGSGQATIMMEAINSPSPYIFPIGHFIKRDFIKEKEQMKRFFLERKSLKF